ncbi:MAG: hypothetical protein GX096_12405 [Clostridiales bacterium]|nr:hypothetical protein [Clostridiales bacterium]
MSLFFETTAQAQIFLATIPLGFLIAVLCDILSYSKRMQPILDVLCLLVCGLVFIFLTLLFKDKGVRLYHILALLVGAILYLFGLRSLLTKIRGRFSKRLDKNRKNTT